MTGEKTFLVLTFKCRNQRVIKAAADPMHKLISERLQIENRHLAFWLQSERHEKSLREGESSSKASPMVHEADSSLCPPLRRTHERKRNKEKGRNTSNKVNQKAARSFCNMFLIWIFSSITSNSYGFFHFVLGSVYIII